MNYFGDCHFRCEDYAISLLEQCEDLREVETFLQTRNSGNKDSNFILAILDSRMKFVAHERFQYVMLKKFGKNVLNFNKNIVTKEIEQFYVNLLSIISSSY